MKTTQINRSSEKIFKNKKYYLAMGKSYERILEDAFNKTFQYSLNRDCKEEFPVWLFSLYNEYSRIIQEKNYHSTINFMRLINLCKKLYFEVLVFYGIEFATKLFKYSPNNYYKVA